MNIIKEWTYEILIELVDCNIIQHLNTLNNTSILDGFHKLKINLNKITVSEVSNCS